MTTHHRARVVDIESLAGGSSSPVFNGHEHGATVSVIFARNPPGHGPALHRHPYDETFIVQSGRARFTAGDDTMEVTAGQIVVVPAGTAHTFVNSGSDTLQQVNIHAAARMQTEWLE